MNRHWILGGASVVLAALLGGSWMGAVQGSLLAAAVLLWSLRIWGPAGWIAPLLVAGAAPQQGLGWMGVLAWALVLAGASVLPGSPSRVPWAIPAHVRRSGIQAVLTALGLGLFASTFVIDRVVGGVVATVAVATWAALGAAAVVALLLDADARASVPALTAFPLVLVGALPGIPLAPFLSASVLLGAIAVVAPMRVMTRGTRWPGPLAGVVLLVWGLLLRSLPF